MKIKSLLAAVCAVATFLNMGTINVGATEPVPDVKAATTVQSVAGEPGRTAVRPQGGVGNVHYVEIIPVAMPAETADGFNLFADRILENAMAGRLVGTGNRITASSLVQSSAPGNCWVLIHVVGVDISLAEFAVKTQSSDSGNALKSITFFDIGRQYGPLALLVSAGEKITSGPSTRTGEELWFFARPPLFKGGSDATNAQVNDWVQYQNATYGDFAVMVIVSLQGKEDLNIAWTVLSTKSTAAPPFIQVSGDGKVSLTSGPDGQTRRCYLLLSAETLSGPWTPVGNLSHDTVFTSGDNSAPQAFFKAMAQ